MDVTYSKQFRKSFATLDRILQVRIRKVIEKLPNGDIKKLKSNHIPPIFRVRIGKYRLLFEMTEHTINVIDIDSRGDIYKRI